MADLAGLLSSVSTMPVALTHRHFQKGGEADCFFCLVLCTCNLALTSWLFCVEEMACMLWKLILEGLYGQKHTFKCCARQCECDRWPDLLNLFSLGLKYHDVLWTSIAISSSISLYILRSVVSEWHVLRLGLLTVLFTPFWQIRWL